MKKILFSILLLGGLPILSAAQRGILLGLPYDDPTTRRDVYSQVGLIPLITEYDRVVKTQIAAFKEGDISKVFGPKLEQRRFTIWNPTNSVAPLFAPFSLSFSGLIGGEDKFHRDLYAVGNIGYLEFFYERDNTLKTAVWYARLNDKFVPLKSGGDFSSRLAWDKAKFEEFKLWLNQHAAK